MKKGHASNDSGTEDTLRSWLSNSRKVVIAGIGNPLRKDDSVGVEVVKRLEGKASGSVYLLECETVPESFIQPIKEFKPDNVLIIDAAILNLEPGALRLIEPRQMAESMHSAISTHALPLRIFCDFLAETTGAKIALLAIQPKDTSFGEGLTPELNKTAKKLAKFLLKMLPSG